MATRYIQGNDRIQGNSDGVAPAAGYVGETIVKYATANTSFSSFTTTDITGATQTLGAGTWLLLIRCGGYASSTGGNANFDIVLRDSANTLIVQNTANWTSGPLCGLPGSVPATVTIPAGNTVTYKIGLASGSQGATGCGGTVLANLTGLTCVRIA